jgi:hypothetical protein
MLRNLRRHFSAIGEGNFNVAAQKESLFTNKYKYEAEVKSVLSKMTRAVDIIKSKNSSDP